MPDGHPVSEPRGLPALLTTITMPMLYHIVVPGTIYIRDIHRRACTGNEDDRGSLNVYNIVEQGRGALYIQGPIGIVHLLIGASMSKAQKITYKSHWLKPESYAYSVQMCILKV